MTVIAGEYNGHEFTLDEKEMFRAADAIEDHLTIFELSAMMADVRKIRIGKVARAYAELLRVAGVPCDVIQLRRELTASIKVSGTAEDRMNSLLKKFGEIAGPLLETLMDGAPAQQKGAEEDNPGNGKAPAS